MHGAWTRSASTSTPCDAPRRSLIDFGAARRAARAWSRCGARRPQSRRAGRARATAIIRIAGPRKGARGPRVTLLPSLGREPRCGTRYSIRLSRRQMTDHGEGPRRGDVRLSSDLSVVSQSGRSATAPNCSYTCGRRRRPRRFEPSTYGNSRYYFTTPPPPHPRSLAPRPRLFPHPAGGFGTPLIPIDLCRA